MCTYLFFNAKNLTMANHPMSIHHRHPKSQGGGEQKWNLINRPQNRHNSWHVLVGNSAVLQLPNLFSEYCPSYNFYVIEKHNNILFKKGLVKPEGYSTKKTKIHKAWQTLFKDKSMSEILNIINTYWSDPRFLFTAYPRHMYWRDFVSTIAGTYPEVKMIWLSHEHPTVPIFI